MNDKDFHFPKMDAERIGLAVSCRDCDSIIKVADAGECFGDNMEFQRMHNGVVIQRGSYHGEWMTEVIRELRGHHEPQEEKVFAEVLAFLEPGALMMELGSFWAYYSMWFQRQVPQAKSILVEPNPEKILVGQEHFRLNGMEGHFIRGFVGAKSEEPATFNDWDGKAYKIRQVTVDAMMEEFGLDFLDILHADVQGAEYDMLLGAIHSLTHHQIGYLFISTHGCEHERCLRLLNKFGYHVIAEHSVLESYSGDGLIVASSPNRKGPNIVQISRRRAGLRERIHDHLACLKRKINQLGKS